MQAHENYRGARHRTMILIYIAWLTLSLAPAMVAPPERTFQRGQPEMQQAMDNMVTRPTIIQKRFGRSVKEESDIQVLKSKTSKLLEEAKQDLKTFPDSNEREWIENFVKKLQGIAKILEKTAQRKDQENDSNFVKDAPVPDGLPKQTAPSAVPEVIPFQKPNDKVSKIQKTFLKVNKDLQNDDKSKRQDVIKPVQLQPALTSKMEETDDDELVRELESLHNEKPQAPPESPKTVSEVVVIATTLSPAPVFASSPAPVFASSPSPKRNHVPSLKEETEKAKMKAKLIEEIDEFHRLGGVMPKTVIDVLYADNHKLAGSNLRRGLNLDEEMKFTEAGMTDRRGMIRLNDVNNEDQQISNANLKNLPPYADQQFQYMKPNQTFTIGYPTFMPGYPKHLQNIPPRAQFYQGNPQMNLYNRGNSAMFHQPGHFPEAFRQRMARPYNFFNGRMLPPNYPSYFMRNNYSPYPYVHSWNPQNSTSYLPSMMTPYAADQPRANPPMSDEMKRELRDGKIVVLSDSVVRSNFEANKNDKVIESTTEKPGSEQIDKKIETTTKN